MSQRPDPNRPVTEAAHPGAARLEELPTRALVELMNDEDARVAPAVRGELDAIAQAIDAIAARLRDGGRLFYVGAGTSGRLGVLDASECPPTFGTPPELVQGLIAGGEAALTRAREGAEDAEEPAREELRARGLAARDAVVGISASGTTPFVRAALDHARSVGALTVALSCNRDTPLARAAAIAIAPVVGPEVVAGSTRLKAGTATKLVLNLLSTGVMVRLGRVQGHYMVDLRATNQKLRERAERMVAELCSVSRERARELLAAHGNSVRAAVAAHGGAAASGGAAPGVARPPAAAGWIAGIDGGGSKTAIALAAPVGSERAVAPLRLAQPCNFASDFEGALAAVEEALAVASAASDRPSAPLAALVVAAAGTGDPQLRARAIERLRARGLAERVALLHDAAPLLTASAPDAAGVALLSGTGSFAFGRDRSGATARAGGLGALLGDDGSAYELGRAALRAAARAADGRGAKLALVRSVFAAVGSDEARAIVRYAWELRSPARIAELAPLVTQAADAGDPTAQRLVERAANELALMAKTVARALVWKGRLPLLLSGGVFDHAPTLRRSVVAALQGMGVAVDVLPNGDAAQGALALARELQAGRLDAARWFPD
ncbi:MAG: N-acetylmuramic acid 6-phosphate etherase [Planctomycetes bacterium]|nr:N-acetylmuramic acid 6-phosphate etherase [Planctomycetota bacterium]